MSRIPLSSGGFENAYSQPLPLPSVKTRKNPVLRLLNKAPSPWVTNAVFTVFSIHTGDFVLGQFALAIWVSLIAIQLLRFCNFKFNWKLQNTFGSHLGVSVSQALVTFILVSPIGALADPPPPAAATCSTAGFLSPLATFADQVFTPAQTAGVTATTIASVQGFTCSLIGFMVLTLILIVVGAIAFFGYQTIINDRNLAEFGRPIAGVVMVIVFCVMFVYMATGAV